MPDENDITIADLYPELTPKQQAEAEYYLERYVAVTYKILRRLEQEGKLDWVQAQLWKEKKKRR